MNTGQCQNEAPPASEENGPIVDIAEMTPRHLERVVEVHLASFDGFFLTFLGPKFLRLLYSELMKESEGVALIAQEKEGQVVVGFVAGLLVATGGLDLWASGETGISAAVEVALTGLVSGALVGALSGALVGALSGAIVRAADV